MTHSLALTTNLPTNQPANRPTNQQLRHCRYMLFRRYMTYCCYITLAHDSLTGDTGDEVSASDLGYEIWFSIKNHLRGIRYAIYVCITGTRENNAQSCTFTPRTAPFSVRFLDLFDSIHNSLEIESNRGGWGSDRLDSISWGIKIESNRPIRSAQKV